MREGRKSTVGEALDWEELDGDASAFCRRHVSSSQLPYSVCASCLRDRLSRLCPDCAQARPCTCLPSTSASTSSSSNGSSRAVNFEPVNGSDTIFNLIASEPKFDRSRSAGFVLKQTGSIKSGLERSRSVATGGDLMKWRGNGGEGKKKKRWAWAAIWPFSKGLNKKGEEKVEKWKWYFPSPIRGFNYRKSVSRAVVV